MTSNATKQQLAALKVGNRVRMKRAARLRPLRMGEVLFADVDLDAPELQGVLVGKLLSSLRCARGVSERPSKHTPAATVARIMHRFGCGSMVRVGDLSAARKDELKAIVADVVARQRPQSTRRDSR